MTATVLGAIAQALGAENKGQMSLGALSMLGFKIEQT